MAVVTVAKWTGAHMRFLDFSAIYDGENQYIDSTGFIIDFGDDSYLEFRGFGFKYNEFNEATAGTVNGFSFSFGHSSAFSIDHISVSVVSIVDAAQTASLADDRALLRSILAGNDTLHGGELSDYLYGGAGNDNIGGNGGYDSLHGNSGNDLLTGGAGDDYLDGGLDADNMRGGAGYDVYVVDHANDIVNDSQAVSNGADTVLSYVAFNLSDARRALGQVENLTLLGTAAINGTGNNLANIINGNNGANVLSGGAGDDLLSGSAGNDTLYGVAGHDRLTGGAGLDNFVFNSALKPATNIDTITDFNPAQDTIRLENAAMAGLGTTLGTLSAAKFWKNTTGLAHDADDRIIYETDTGKLFYDANGTGAGGSVHFATLSNKAAITNLDFVVI